MAVEVVIDVVVEESDDVILLTRDWSVSLFTYLQRTGSSPQQARTTWTKLDELDS